jgi:hypothetical protein
MAAQDVRFLAGGPSLAHRLILRLEPISYRLFEYVDVYIFERLEPDAIPGHVRFA